MGQKMPGSTHDKWQQTGSNVYTRVRTVPTTREAGGLSEPDVALTRTISPLAAAWT